MNKNFKPREIFEYEWNASTFRDQKKVIPERQKSHTRQCISRLREN